MSAGMSKHTSPVSVKDEWLTPPWLLEKLGPFDLDPCAPVVRPWDTAKRHYTIEDNGLLLPWEGRVWLNPPYDKTIGDFITRLRLHGNGLALIYARTDTELWQREVFPRASAVLLIEGRLHFHHVNGERAAHNCGAPSALIAYGSAEVEALRCANIPGYFIDLRKS